MVQPVQFTSTTRPFVNRKTVKQSRYTSSTELEVQNCKSTIQSALVFLSKYFKKVDPVTHSHKKHITVLRQYQFQLLFEPELEKRNRDTEVRLAHGVLQSTNFISHWWKVASGKMEITVRVVSCLLGTCFVIDYVPVKSEILINERKKRKMLAQEAVSW